MEKNAVISVKSFSDLDKDEVIEVVTPGKLYINENEYKVIYEESELSGMDGTTTTITIQEDSMILEREGSVNTKMEFKEGEMAVSLYNTPYGMLDLNIDTQILDINMCEIGGAIYTKYVLGLADQEGITTELKIKINAN